MKPNTIPPIGMREAYAFPGGYPIIYFTDGGLCVCPDCANRECDDHVTGMDVHWEGEPMTCDDCGTMIESAYGVPDKAEVRP